MEDIAGTEKNVSFVFFFKNARGFSDVSHSFISTNIQESDRYGIDILDKEDIAWRTKYPNIAKRIDDLEQRLHRIEVEEERHKGDGK